MISTPPSQRRPRLRTRLPTPLHISQQPRPPRQPLHPQRRSRCEIPPNATPRIQQHRRATPHRRHLRTIHRCRREARPRNPWLVNLSSISSLPTTPTLISLRPPSIDALVNNAGVGLSGGSLAEQMSTCFATNATGPLLVLEAFAPYFENLKRPQGS